MIRNVKMQSLMKVMRNIAKPKKTKGSKWAKIFTISMPKRPPVAARTSSQSMQLIVLHVQHSAPDSSEIETYCDLL